MREIKFRVFDPNTNEIIASNIGIDKIYLYDFAGDNITEQDGLVIMQYTGLKDKNGKEIYEGDIVSTDLSRPYLIVEFRNGAFMYQCHHGGQDYYDHMEPAFEDEKEFTKYHAVIGNIYENPELLEKSK